VDRSRLRCQVPGRAAQVDLNHPVMGPLTSVPGGVGQEDHVGELVQQYHSRVVLG